MVPPPDENLNPRRTVTQAQQERQASEAQAQEQESAAEAAWAAKEGLEDPQQAHDPSRLFAPVRGVQDDQEDDQEDDEEEDGEDGTDPDEEAFAKAFGETETEDTDPEDGDDAEEEEPDPEPRRRKRRRGQRRANAATKKAIEILKAQGVPQAVLDTTDPDALVAWGMEAASSQRGPQAPEQKTPPPQSAEFEDSLFEALADQLAVPVSELKKSHGPLIDGILARVRQEMEGRLAPLEGSMRQTTQASTRQAVMGNLERLSQFRPELKSDQELQADLTEAAAEHWNARTPSGARLYGTLEEAFDAAFRAEIGEMVPSSSTRQVTRKRRNGTATIPSGRSTARAKVRTEAEFEEESFRHIMDGKSPQWVLENVARPSRSGKGGRSRRS